MPVRYSLISATRDPRGLPNPWLAAQRSADSEVVVVANPGRCGLGAAYNEGLARAQGEFCCFLHDDVEIRRSDWRACFAQAVARGFDLVGVAGSTHLPRTGAWWTAGRGAGRGTVTHRSSKGRLDRMRFGPPDDPQEPPAEVVSLDGVVLFGRREAFRQRPFDEQFFDGFHFYDSDLSLRWLLWDGRRLGVVGDLDVVHRQGASLAGWQPYANRFSERHGGFLPLRLEEAALWQRNRRALAMAQPETLRVLACSRRPGRAYAFDSTENGVQATTLDGARLVNDPELPALSAAPWILCLGVGSGTLLDALVTQARRPIVVIEPESHLACWVLCRRDLSVALLEGRLHLLCPAADSNEAEEVALRELTLQLAARCRAEGEPHVIASGSAAMHATFFERLQRAIRTLIDTNRQVAAWPAVMHPPPTDVAVVSPRCAIFNDLAQCFAELGLRTKLWTIPDRPGEWSPVRWRHFLRQMRDEPSRLLVFRNRAGLEAWDADHPIDLGAHLPAPFVSWWWDRPNVASQIELKYGTEPPPYVFAQDLSQAFAGKARWLPPAARMTFVIRDTARAPLDFPLEDRLTFVGQSRYTAMCRHLNILANTLAYYDGRLGQRLANAVNGAPSMKTLHHRLVEPRQEIEAAFERLAGPFPFLAGYLDYLWRMAETAAFRLAAIERLASLPLLVFGDDGWLQAGVVRKEHFAGLLAPGHLPELYRRSRVNLNVSFMQVSSTVHPKVLDVCAAGGVVLTDPRPELDVLFPNEPVRPWTFHSLDDLPDRAAALLADDAEERRRALAEHVAARHLMVHRARVIADDFGLTPPHP